MPARPPLPPNAVVVGPSTYYYGGTSYQMTGGSYQVVAPQAGTVVDELPAGGEEITVGDQRYVRFGDTYYQPIEVNGQPKYEIVEVR